MTTTIFRKSGNTACIASDSRVSWVDKNTHLVTRWFDSTGFYKTLTIDGVMYGFAGTNAMFRAFLELYTTKTESEFVLDSVVEFAKQNRIQFFIIRYADNELKLFAYSPEDYSQPEIYRISTDPVLDTGMFAIGSGKYSKAYRKNKLNAKAQAPIYKIISANAVGLKKQGILGLAQQVEAGSVVLSPEESRKAYLACQKAGGDLFTGGDVNMSQSVTRQQIDKQIDVLKRMDQEASTAGAVCASPVDANLEVSQLKAMGQYAVSPNTVEICSERAALLKKMEESLAASIEL